MAKNVARLYTQFQPESYDLHITIDEASMRFYGNVTVHGRKVGRPSQRLTFHANGLTVNSATITKYDKKGTPLTVPISRIHHHKTRHEVRLHSDDLLYPGKYTVTLQFEAPITDGMTGIYPCYFNDAKGQIQKLIATQFESHHAREAFPCIDEPEAKAIFTVTLTTRDNVKVLSNMPIATQKRLQPDSQATNTAFASGKTAQLQTIFNPTPRMSTYLLAFVYGDLHKKSTSTKSGTDITVWATTVQPVESLDFALDIAKRSVEFFEDYFDVPYPLPKLDHVALPDFSSGAMENWGLVTYRERVLLAYPGEVAQSTLERIALVVSHETSHQWFGNLVTMKWWDNLWLNESFADIMEYACMDHMFPEWHVWDNFVAEEGLSAFRRDAVYGVQAVQCAVHHPDEISSLFDPSIVYAKGGRILYMLKNYLGEDAWRRGLSDYFKEFAYGNTAGEDLWAALSAASGKDVAAFMNPWLTRSGFPVVHVHQDGRKVLLEQEHFLDDPVKADKTRLWPVPTFANEVDIPEVFSTSQLEAVVSSGNPVLLNSKARGHYIIDYRSATTQKMLVEKIGAGMLPDTERLMLLSDNTMLARAGYQSYDIPLFMLSVYKYEASEPVWGIMSMVAGEVRRFVDRDPSLETRIQHFTSQIIQQQYERLGWDEKPGESTADQKLRGTILALGIYAKDTAISTEANKRFNNFRLHDVPLTPELRDIIMCVPVKQGDDLAFDFLRDLHDRTQNSELKADICSALTATEQPKRAAELLARLKDPALVKPQDADRWLFYLMRNRYTRDTAWQWMVDNWGWLEKTYQNDKSYDYLPRYAAACVNTAAYAKKFHDLFDDKADQPILKRNIELGSEEIATRLAWLNRDEAAIQAFFATIKP